MLKLGLLLCSLHVQASVAALSLLKARLPGRFPTELTGLWTGLAEDRKWRRDVAEALLRARLLNGPEMDAHLSKVLQLSRSSTQTVEFAVHLVSSQLSCFPCSEGGSTVSQTFLPLFRNIILGLPLKQAPTPVPFSCMKGCSTHQVASSMLM